jgi:hypothetical protein
MGINLAGMGAAYEGFREDQQLRAAEDRRKKQEERLDQDQEYAQEMRKNDRADRARKESDRLGSEHNRKKFLGGIGGIIADVPDIAMPVQPVSEQGNPVTQPNPFDPSDTRTDGVPAQPVSTTSKQVAASADISQPASATIAAPSSVAPAQQVAKTTAQPIATTGAAPSPTSVISPIGGIKQAQRNFYDNLKAGSDYLAAELSEGRGDFDKYAVHEQNIKRYQAEGVNDALQSFHNGDYQEGIDKFNSVGRYRGAKILSTATGTAKVDGMDVPTHIVVIKNADGSTSKIDTALSQAQMRKYEDQIKGAREAVTRSDSRTDSDRTYALNKVRVDTEKAARAEAAAARRDHASAISAGNYSAPAAAWTDSAEKSFKEAFTFPSAETGKDDTDYAAMNLTRPLVTILTQKSGGKTWEAIAQARQDYDVAKRTSEGDPQKMREAINATIKSLSTQPPTPTQTPAKEPIISPNLRINKPSAQPPVPKPLAVGSDPAANDVILKNRQRLEKQAADKAEKEAQERATKEKLASDKIKLASEISDITLDDAYALSPEQATEYIRKYRTVIPRNIVDALLERATGVKQGRTYGY